jgi:hypothetical protein
MEMSCTRAFSMFALLICSLIYLVEKALVQLISISYHRKQFDAKIIELLAVVADGDELYKSFLDQVNEAADEQRKQDIPPLRLSSGLLSPL